MKTTKTFLKRKKTEKKQQQKKQQKTNKINEKFCNFLFAYFILSKKKKRWEKGVVVNNLLVSEIEKE